MNQGPCEDSPENSKTPSPCASGSTSQATIRRSSRVHDLVNYFQTLSSTDAPTRGRTRRLANLPGKQSSSNEQQLRNTPTSSAELISTTSRATSSSYAVNKSSSSNERSGRSQNGRPTEINIPNNNSAFSIVSKQKKRKLIVHNDRRTHEERAIFFPDLQAPERGVSRHRRPHGETSPRTSTSHSASFSKDPSLLKKFKELLESLKENDPRNTPANSTSHCMPTEHLQPAQKVVPHHHSDSIPLIWGTPSPLPIPPRGSWQASDSTLVVRPRPHRAQHPVQREKPRLTARRSYDIEHNLNPFHQQGLADLAHVPELSCSPDLARDCNPSRNRGLLTPLLPSNHQVQQPSGGQEGHSRDREKNWNSFHREGLAVLMHPPGNQANLRTKQSPHNQYSTQKRSTEHPCSASLDLVRLKDDVSVQDRKSWPVTTPSHRRPYNRERSLQRSAVSTHLSRNKADDQPYSTQLGSRWRYRSGSSNRPRRAALDRAATREAVQYIKFLGKLDELAS